MKISNEELIKKYEGANAIYLLTRTKKMNKAEMILDGAVALFTPLGGIVKEADTVADLGTYFLVEKNNDEILVRVQGEELTEELISGKYEMAGKKIIYGNNYFKKVKNICQK